MQEHQQPTIKLRDAIARMRQLSAADVPFSFSFISYSDHLQKSDGLKHVDRGLLRKGYRADQSNYHNILVAYTTFDSKEGERHFYLPLLMTFNEYRVLP